MSWLWVMFIYLNSWWITLFVILPLGISHRRVVQAEDYASAPDAPNIRQKIILTSVISAGITLVICLLLMSGLVPLRDMIK